MEQPKKPSPSKYFLSLLLHMPAEKRYPLHNVQIMVLYFALESLDVANQLHLLDNTVQEQIIDHIYSLQINNPVGGFFPSSIYPQIEGNKYQLSHIIFTYSALNSLKILGDDLGRVNKQSILMFLKSCKKQDGSFSNFEGSEECDLRFVYGALCVCAMMEDFSVVDTEKTLQYIDSCYNYDGGYGLRPNCESHSGGIYTALASLQLLGEIDRVRGEKKGKILHFLSSRQSYNLEAEQIIGVQGRVGKIPDSCYTFWVGASIEILTGQNLLNPNLQKFLDLCHKQNGTYSKYPFMNQGDPQHTLHSLVGLKIIRNDASDLCLEKGIKKCRV